ncbi:hypothetical protein V2J09_020687 [Rumex salicifolius]
MDSDDFSLIDIGHEDDSLLRNLPPDDAGRFACSPLIVAGSAGSSRPPKTTVLKDKAHFGEIGGTLPNNNKENLIESCNNSSNLSMEPQKMKRNRKTGGYNLRKSLAWDKAFFTEEGVLSSSELSMICGTPSKLDGKYMPAIPEEQRTPMHANTTPTNLQTIESKSFRKLHPSNTKDKRTREGSNLKQKSLESRSVKSKKLASTASTKNSERKEGSSKPLAQISKIPRVPVFKPDAHFSTTTASSSDASHVKRNRIAPPAPIVQKQLGQKGCSNTRSTSNGPKIVPQRVPNPSKSSNQRTRKNRTAPCSQKQSTSQKVSNIKAVNSSEISLGKTLPVGLEANNGTFKAAVSIHANTGNTCNIGQSIQHQVAKPSGLRMPSPSLRFFSEPKISIPNGVGQRKAGLGQTCNPVQSNIPKASMGRISAPCSAKPCSVSSISHNVGTILSVIHSKIPKATMERVSIPGPVQPCSVSSINSPKIYDELVHGEKDELNVSVKALLDEKPLGQIKSNCVEEVGKHYVEHEHTSPSIMGVDGKDDRSVSPIRECLFNDIDLFQSSENQLMTPWIDNRSDCHAKLGQDNLPVMSEGLGLESEAYEYAVHTPTGSNCCLEVPYRINGYKEAQDLQCPSHIRDEVSHISDGLSSKNEDLLKRSFSPERISRSDAIDSIMAEIEVYKPLVVRETFSASLENILDTPNKQQELEVLQCPLPLMEIHVQSAADGSIVEDDAFKIDADEDKASKSLPLKMALTASLDTKPNAEDHVGLSIAEYTNETDLTGQNADFELYMSPRACKSTSQVDAVLCDVELPLSQAQGLVSTAAELSTLETDQPHMIYYELVREPLMPTSPSLQSREIVCEKDLSLSHTQLFESKNMEILLHANKNENQSVNSPATNNSEACSPCSSLDLSFPLKTSKDYNIGVDRMKTDYQMNQEHPSRSLKNHQGENHVILIDDSSSGNDSMSDQAIIQEPQYSSRISGDTITSASNCDVLVSSSPCKSESTTVRNESVDERDEQLEIANHHEDHDIDNKEEKTRLRIVNDGKIQPQLVIRPPEDVAPFSDEWLAAVEAAGEDILTLKTGPVQNSPPSRLPPEPSPWSPVKRKNNQGIGPYDCTKYSTGQH